MTFAVIAKIDDVNDTTIFCHELTGARTKLQVEYTGGVEVKKDDEIIFTGDFTEHGLVAHNNVSIRRFLEPLNEEELFEASARFKMVQTINDPFPAAYKHLYPIAEAIKEKDNEEENVVITIETEADKEEFYADEE